MPSMKQAYPWGHEVCLLAELSIQGCTVLLVQQAAQAPGQAEEEAAFQGLGIPRGWAVSRCSLHRPYMRHNPGADPATSSPSAWCRADSS